MFNLEEQLIEVAGPLTCISAHLLDPEEEPDRDQLKLAKGHLFFWGMHHIPSPWKAWARINPDLKSFASETTRAGKTSCLDPDSYKRHPRNWKWTRS